MSYNNICPLISQEELINCYKEDCALFNRISKCCSIKASKKEGIGHFPHFFDGEDIEKRYSAFEGELLYILDVSKENRIAFKKSDLPPFYKDIFEEKMEEELENG